MYLTLLVIGIICLVVGIKFALKKDWCDGGWIVPFIVGMLLTLVFSIVSIVEFSNIAKTERTIEQRIQLYEDYNEEIKAQVDAVAQQYVDYEGGIYENFNTQDILLIVPELDANTVIMEQIALYEANQLKILELRERKLDLSADKFMLYWGK